MKTTCISVEKSKNKKNTFVLKFSKAGEGECGSLAFLQAHSAVATQYSYTVTLPPTGDCKDDDDTLAMLEKAYNGKEVQGMNCFDVNVCDVCEHAVLKWNISGAELEDVSVRHIALPNGTQEEAVAEVRKQILRYLALDILKPKATAE